MADSVDAQPQYDAAHVRGYYPAAACHVAQQLPASVPVDFNVYTNPPAIETVEYYNRRTVTSWGGSTSVATGGAYNFQGSTTGGRCSAYVYNGKMYLTTSVGTSVTTWTPEYVPGRPFVLQTNRGTAVTTYGDESRSGSAHHGSQTFDRFRVLVVQRGAIAYELNLNYVRWAGACYAWQPLQDATGNNAVIELTQATIYEL